MLRRIIASLLSSPFLRCLINTLSQVRQASSYSLFHVLYLTRLGQFQGVILPEADLAQDSPGGQVHHALQEVAGEQGGRCAVVTISDVGIVKNTFFELEHCHQTLFSSISVSISIRLRLSVSICLSVSVSVSTLHIT